MKMPFASALAFLVLQVSSVEGDATVNNRKNKIIVGYELHVKASWEGQLPGTCYSLLAIQTTPSSLSLHLAVTETAISRSWQLCFVLVPDLFKLSPCS